MTDTSKPEPINFTTFLESTPPARRVWITDVAKVERKSGTHYLALTKPQLHLHCTSANCRGFRFFRCIELEDIVLSPDRTHNIFLRYICSNCRDITKTFALMVDLRQETPTSGQCYKYGEFPAYGPPAPSRLIEMSGDDRETFIKGRRCEMQGLGIGAFVYYRRVVENQKNTIFDEIIRVSKKIGVPTSMINTLELAKNETQFSKALASVKDAIPQSLLINGHNPITLLHRALSGGLHEQSDDDCLNLAHDVRVVLAELAERLGQALKDEAELNTAVSRLMNPQTLKTPESEK